MTPAKTARIAWLEDREHDSGDTALSTREQTELATLRLELALEPEVADNPATLFVDESRRPDVVHGGDYNDTLHAMACAEVEPVLLRFGEVAMRLALDALTKR